MNQALKEAESSVRMTIASVSARLAFVRSAEIPYPSLYDPGSEQLLRFPPPINPRDIPSTVVLDAEGRVAALIRGELPSKLTLLDVVEEVTNG